MHFIVSLPEVVFYYYHSLHIVFNVTLTPPTHSSTLVSRCDFITWLLHFTSATISMAHKLIAKVSSCGGLRSTPSRIVVGCAHPLINDLNLMDYKIHLNVNHGPASERSTWIQNGHRRTSERPNKDPSCTFLYVRVILCGWRWCWPPPSLWRFLLSVLGIESGWYCPGALWTGRGSSHEGEIYGHLIECFFNGTGHQFYELRIRVIGTESALGDGDVFGPSSYTELWTTVIYSNNIKWVSDCGQQLWSI